MSAVGPERLRQRVEELWEKKAPRSGELVVNLPVQRWKRLVSTLRESGETVRVDYVARGAWWRGWLLRSSDMEADQASISYVLLEGEVLVERFHEAPESLNAAARELYEQLRQDGTPQERAEELARMA